MNYEEMGYRRRKDPNAPPTKISGRRQPPSGFNHEFSPEGRRGRCASNNSFPSDEDEGRQMHYHYSSSNDKSRSATPGARETPSSSSGGEVEEVEFRAGPKRGSHKQEPHREGNQVCVSVGV